MVKENEMEIKKKNKKTPTALFQKDAAIISSDFRKKSTNRLTP